MQENPLKFDTEKTEMLETVYKGKEAKLLIMPSQEAGKLK
jgi:hypothetical protein